MRTGDCHRYTPPMTLVLAQLRQQLLLFRRTWGELSLVPARGRALSRTQQRAIVASLANNDLGWDVPERDAVLALKHYTMSTGTRLEELALVDAADDALPRSHFSFHSNGRPLPRTPQGFQAVTDGCYLEVRSCSSKCDPDNMHWGAKSMWFVVDFTEEFNLASRWAAYELAYPCPPASRGSWAAFSPTGGPRAFTCAHLVASLDRGECGTP